MTNSERDRAKGGQLNTDRDRGKYTGKENVSVFSLNKILQHQTDSWTMLTILTMLTVYLGTKLHPSPPRPL